MYQHIFNIENPVECRIVGRLNRFVVEVEQGRHNLKASINNTGRLHQFLVKGKTCYCLKREKPGKTDFRLFAIRDEDSAAIIDTQFQMNAFENALEQQIIPWLPGFRMVKRNARFGDSLIDYLLERNEEKVLLEVKSAVLRDGLYAMYPDCPTARGRKHIRELTDHVCNGGISIILFLAALPGIEAFKSYREGDAELCDLLESASAAGVEIRSMAMVYEPENSSIYLGDPNLPITFG